jgi:outer membrane translocation and assembly module TamA
MSDAIVVYKKRTNVITVSMGIDVSADQITSEIRTESGALIATWHVTFDSDGKDGELILRLDDSETSGIEYEKGLMDIKRVTGGEPVPVFEMPLEVEFRKSVTV